MRKVITLAIVALAMMVTMASASATGSAWNQFAAAYHFDSYPQSARTTVGQAYHGSNYASDINGICGDMSKVLVSPVEPPDGPDDVLNAWIESQ